MGKPRRFSNRQLSDEEMDQDYFDGLIRVSRDEYKPGEIAKRVHLSLARKKLNVGGLGSGKTRTMCEHINNMLLTYPGGKGILCRKDLGDLKKTAQSDYLDKVVSHETIDRFNINENTLYYKNGSRLFFMETKTPSNFKSMEIIVYGVEEADENEEGVGKDRLMTMLDGRLRQKIKISGTEVPIPYCGIWTYNPTTDDHWLSRLEDTPEHNMEVFRGTTYDNQHNLPPDYIPSLLGSLAPWEIRSLIYGERAMRPKGKPVIHGFSYENNVRPIRLYDHLPIRRSWDFGFNHPCISLAQFDPIVKRYLKFGELMGNCQQLKFFAPEVKKYTRSLVPKEFQIIDACDPHGDDQKDVGESSVEYLRLNQDIFCNFQRQKLKKGLDEIQEMVIAKAPYKPPEWVEKDPILEESRFLVDPRCKLSIESYLGGYYRNAEGLPHKDDVHDHPVDTDRYNVVHTMGIGLAAHRKKNQKRYIPRNVITGY